MKKYKKLLIGGLVVISLLLILPFFVSTEAYIEKAEQAASDTLGVPVTISSGHFSLLPSPRVTVNEVVFGKNEDVTIERLTVVPAISTLFSATRSIDLEITKPIVKESAMAFVSALSNQSSESVDTPVVSVGHVAISDLRLIWPEISFPMMDVMLNMTDSALDSALLETTDGKLKAELTPQDGEHLIQLSAENWTLPVGLPLLIDNAKLEMHLKGNRLEVPNINIGLYQGKVAGNAILSWGKRWKVSGKLNVSNLSVQAPSYMMSKSVYMSGHLFGDGSFSSKAKAAGRLADYMRANFKFNVNNGVLHGLDLVKVASLLLKQGQNGGSTKFDEFSGRLNVVGKQYHLRNIKMKSGLLSAKGQVKVSPKKNLKGLVRVEVKQSVALVEIPLAVSGTVDNPVVLPTKAALVGAVAGSVALPVVGTSLGIKAADEASKAVDTLKGLFGGD